MSRRRRAAAGSRGGAGVGGVVALAAVLATALGGTAEPALAQDAGDTQDPLPSVEELMDHLDDLYRASSSYAVMTMTVVRERGTRELTMESWSKGDDRSLVVIRQPPREAGTATLLTEEGLWNYAPRADRLIRIPTGLLSDAWMGSHFTNDDLVRETSYREDYETELSWAEGEAGGPLIVAALTPRPDAPVVYTRIEYRVRPGDWVPLRADYFDEGELVRTMRFEEVETVGGRPVPMRMILRPTDARSGVEERTEVVYEELEFDLPVEDDLFTRRGLRRVAQGAP